MHTPDLIAPTRAACVACDRRPAARDVLVCSSCEAGLDADLRYIAAGYPLLDGMPATQPMSASGGRRIAYGSRSPARDDQLVLTDPRPCAWDPDAAETRVQSLIGLVRHWIADAVMIGIVDERELARHSRTLAVSPGGLVEVQRGRPVVLDALRLAALVPILARHWDVGELARQCAAQAQHLRRALGDDVALTVVGACPLPDAADPLAVVQHAELVEELGDIPAALALPQLDVPTCAGRLRSRGWGHPVRCAGCGQRWAGERALRELGAMLGGAMLDMPGLVRYFAMDGREATLRKWAQRDGWARERVGRTRVVYSLVDARRSWWASWDREHAVTPQPTPPAPALAVVVPMQRGRLVGTLAA